MKSRKQRILSIALVLAMLLAMFPTAAYAAGSGISVSQSAVKTGDTFTVSVQVPAISTNLSNFKLSVAFDKTAFELTAFAPVSLQNATLTSSTLAEAKTNGVYIASYLGNSGDNVIDLSSGYTLNATFRVLDSATAGRKNFSLVKSGSIACKFISLDRDGYTEIDHTPAGMAETVSVSVVSTISGALPISITAPVKGGTPQSTIADGMGYTGTITWEGSPAAFAASTAYTAVVELTAKSGYQFTNDVEPTVDGASSVTEKIVDADGSKLTFKAIFPKTAEADALSGSVLIAGIAKFGETLTADTSLLDYGSEDAGTLRYQWIRGGAEIRGATQRTYTLTAADVGNTIVVEVKNSNNSGRVISANTAIVAKADYSGAAATAATVSKTANSVTVTNVTSGQEYAITTGSSAPTEGWNPAGTFTGLNANTSYKVYTRVAATATTNASESVCTDVTTDKASGSITIAEPGTITYDGSAVEVGSGKDMNYSYTGDGAVTVKWYKDNSGSKGDELTGSTPKDAGTYWIGVSAAEGTNSAAVAEVTMKFTISPKALSNDMIELGTQNTYSGTEQGVAISAVKDGTTSLISSRDYEVKSGNKATNVGNNTLIIEGMGNYIGTASTSWTLVAKEVTLTWENYSSRTYGDGKTVTATVSNKVDTDEVNVTVSGGNETAVGSHTATATGLTGAQSGNYKLPTTTPTQNYDIGKAAAPTDVKADFEVLYNDTAEKAVTISNFNLPNDIANASFKDTATGKTGDDVIQSFENTKFVLKSGLTESNNGNTASWTVTIQSDNYGDITATVNVKVIKKHLNTTTLAVSQSNFTYGEGTDNPTVSNKPATAGTVTFSYSGRGTTAYGPASAAPTAAGDYTVTARCEDSEYIYTATADFTISKKSITGAEVTLGTALIYNGSSQTQGVTMVELDGTDIISFCTVSENAGTNAGDYTLKVTAKNASNYTGDVTKQFTIAKKSITPTIEVSGSYAYNNGVMILPNFTVKDGTATLAENDYAAVITDNVNAGSGKITVTETTTGNYTFSETQQSFTINKANYGNKTASGSAKYGTTGSVDLSGYLAEGGNFGTVTATDTNGVFSSTPAMDGNALKFTFVNEASKVSKTATITVPVTGATNYENYEINVTVTVTDKVTPTVTAPTAKTGLVYNGANQVLIDAGSVTGGTLQYSLTTGGDYSTELPKAKNAGNYTVYYKVIGNDDYADVAENSISVSIAKRTISVKADNKSMTVNGTLPAFTVSYGNFASDDSEANVIETEATASCKADGTSVGSFPITVSGTTVLKSGMDTNYEIGTPENGTLTVNSQSSSGGGGGGSAVPTYTVSADKSENGTVSISPKSAAKGDTVTVTVTPDKGYVLETLTVLDKNGKEITLTEKNGKYTFTMPAGKVEVKATFMDDNTMLNYFVDVKTGDYYYDAVLWAAGKGITSGTDTTHFSPNASCTRAQIVTFLWRAAGSPKPKSMGSFMDVSADSYYAKAVAWAVEDGITSGTGDGKFSPNATCTREQAVAFLYRSSGSPAVSGGSAFSDVAANAYYADAVAWAEKNEITCGIGGGLFGSGNDCTRGQIVTFLYRTMEKPLSNEMPA